MARTVKESLTGPTIVRRREDPKRERYGARVAATCRMSGRALLFRPPNAHFCGTKPLFASCATRGTPVAMRRSFAELAQLGAEDW